MTMLAKNS